MSLVRSLLLLVILVLPFSGIASASSPEVAIAWEPVAAGIDYARLRLPGPINVFVTRMDRFNLSLTLDSSIAQGKLLGGRETVSSMFSRYDQALNFWGGSSNPPDWGMRNQVVVAINGAYFKNYGTPIPTGVVHSGWYAQRYEDLGGWSGFAWKLDRTPFIGECVVHPAGKQLVSFPDSVNTLALTNVNTSRGSDELILYTPQYDVRTGTDNFGVEVLVEMTRPTMVLPWQAYASGIVRRIAISEGNNLIPFNDVVLSATGSAAEALLENVQLGSEVRISQEITSYDADCSTSNSLNWTKTYASLQGAFYFLKDGQIRDFNDDPGATEKNPRTAIAYNGQYIYFIVVDGRDYYHSLGMTIHELALFTRDTIGASYGVAQDGGGSSTMVINGQVVNNTYCNNHYCWWQYMPLVRRGDQYTQTTPAAQVGNLHPSTADERPVANGMLMVIAQPAVFSATFSPADPVKTVSNTDVRLGPGWDYPVFVAFPPGTPGTIASQLNGLDGVLAKGAYWWYVDFGSVTGWVTEAMIVNP